MCATTRARALFTLASFIVRCASVFVALLTSFYVLFVCSAPRAGAMFTRIFISMRATCVFVALLTSFYVLFMAAALIDHCALPFFEMRRSFNLAARQKTSRRM
ncbi:hypothetical protein BJI49_11090 [Acetobacter pasteurianus]|nr:hypothetical protein BJI49_11090 [Acetobacter pasteurianus]